jgi:FHS family L-fucose permease-like MFS transporter
MIFLYSIIAFSAMRFIFTWLMKYVTPSRLLAVATIVALACTAVVMLGSGWTAVVALVAISGCMSLMFPTIYGIALDGIQGDTAKIAASGLIMAILGGALITPVQAMISDACGISASFIIPLLCFAVILIYALAITRRNTQCVGRE